MIVVKKKRDQGQNSLLDLVMFRYVPYWPLFIILMLVSGVSAYCYLQYFAVPTYRSSASILIKDEKKGVGDSKTIESINSVESKTIVENELKVISSRPLLEEVVSNLHLYAPVSEEERFKDIPAYTTSPVAIEAQHPESIEPKEKIYFSYNPDSSQVTIGSNSYALNKWVETPFGVLRFSKNGKKTADPGNPLFFTLNKPYKAVADILVDLKATPPDKFSSVIEITYDDKDRQRGKDVLSELIKAYNISALNEKNKLATKTLAFLDDRIRDVEKQIDSIEKQVQTYKSSRGIVNLSQQGELYLQNVGDNDKRLSDINTQLSVLDEVEKRISSEGDNSNLISISTGINDPGLSSMLDKLYTSELQYEKLKKTTGENSPILSSVVNEINRMKPDVLQRIKSQRKSLEANKSSLSSTNNGYASILQTIPQKEKELLEITREQATKNEVYAFLLQKREETALSRESTVTENRVLEPPAFVKIVSPIPLFIYLISLVLAFIAAIAYVFTREFLTNKIMFRSEIDEFTSVPVVAEITHMSRKGNIFVKNSKKLAKTALSEQFRQLRMGLGLYSRQTPKKKFVVTSSIGGEGKSFISSNFAKSLAASGKKVVLIDFDMRNPKTSGLFNLDGKNGLKEYLDGEVAGTNEICYAMEDTANLFIIPAGKEAVNPTELLLSSRLGELFEILEKRFDYIVADTAPVQPVTDAYIISEYCDVTLYAVRHRYTPKAMIQLLDENNKIKALKEMQIVFNDVKSRGFLGKTGFGYGYGYGYEYGYGERKYMGK
jgi:capsular exopolysaccharide synthesis family protein